LNQNPLVQVVFALQNIPTWVQPSADAPPPADDAAPPAEMSTGTSKFELTVSLGELGPSLFGAFEYATDLFEPPTIARMIEHFKTLLADIVANPDQRLSSFRLFTDDETGGFTPLDFPDAQLNQKEFESLLQELGQVAGNE
jgi:non-ribosomal peptide synthetase component F